MIGGQWRGGRYDSVECDNPDLFYRYIPDYFQRLPVAEAIEQFGSMVQVTKYPLSLLRAVALVSSIKI